MFEPEDAVISLTGSINENHDGYIIYGALSNTDSDAAELLSSLLATLNVDQGCDVHENCNGRCGFGSETQFRTKFRPSLAGPESYVVTFVPGSRSVESDVVERRPPQDEAWLQQQHLLPFKHDSIDSKAGFIRLLKVKNAIYRADVLDCELQAFEISKAPPFEALSYSCGPPIFDHTILVNGQILYIAKPLHSALKRFRQCREDDRLGHLWADAICINQNDKIELNRQVLQMHNIYSTAQRVRIDLGECSSDWFEGLNLMWRLQYAAEANTIKSTKGVSPNDLYARCGIPSLDHSAWSKYLELFASPWFTRTWIIQEVALAKGKKFFFGRFSFTWEAFVTSLNVIESVSPGILALKGSQSPYGYLNSVKIRQLITWQKRPRSTFAPLYPLAIAKDFESTDPKDKIISLLGLINEQPHVFKDGVLQPFEPDYTVDVATLYHRHTVYLFRLFLGLGALNFAGIHRRVSLQPTAPSWVVDWTAQSRTFLTSHFATLRSAAYAAASEMEFESSLESSEPDSELDLLTVTGTCFDTIATVSSVLDFRKSPQTQTQDGLALKWYHEVENLITKHMNDDANAATRSGHYGGAWRDALALTLLAGDTYTGENAVGASESIIEPAKILKLAVNHLEQVTSGRSDIVQLLSISTEKSAGERRLATFITQMTTACRQRRFAITEKGRFALVPECADGGDLVCLVLGCPIALVIGSKEANERLGRGQRFGRPLVGDAYVQGMMEGELIGTEEFESGKRTVWIS